VVDRTNKHKLRQFMVTGMCDHVNSWYGVDEI
jgi:hypothetical protein